LSQGQKASVFDEAPLVLMMRMTVVAPMFALGTAAGMCGAGHASCSGPLGESVLLQTSRHSLIQPDAFCDMCIEKFESIGGCDADLQLGWTISPAGTAEKGGKGSQGGEGGGVDPLALLGGKGGKGASRDEHVDETYNDSSSNSTRTSTTTFSAVHVPSDGGGDEGEQVNGTEDSSSNSSSTTTTTTDVAVHIPAGCERCGDAIMQKCLRDARRSGNKMDGKGHHGKGKGHHGKGKGHHGKGKGHHGKDIDVESSDGRIQRDNLQAESCTACLEDMGSADECSVMFTGEASPPLPSSCAGASHACMTRAAVKCGVQSVDGCQTAEETQPCFKHVRWSMQHGITEDPAQYPGLTQESNFEEFQALLHEQGVHDCPAPCKVLPETQCHTAIPGEACFRHTTWAMTAGPVIKPEWYPAALLKEGARFEDFQAWLHKIHHGDCPRPCKQEEELVEKADS